MIEKIPTGDTAVAVTFRVPAEAGARTASVTGEFNDWSTTATPMTETDDGGFCAVVTLERGRSYRFRYHLDGERWENDWAADGYVGNEYGGDDSLVDLTDPVEVAPNGNGAPSRPRRNRAPKKTTT